MFTGLIQQVGRLAMLENTAAGARMRVAAVWPAPLTPGESIAVNGVCITVALTANGWFAGDLLRETLDRTNLGRMRPGDKLNLERALRMGDAVGGHWVTGHVDGVGTVRQVRAVGRDLTVRIGCSNTLSRGIVYKGSVAVDGISLTVATLESDAFVVHLIPWTRATTACEQWQAGVQVNLETDIIGKYALRQMETAAPSGLTPELMRSAGF